MKRTAAALAAALLCSAAASAQSYPDTKPGFELGVQQVNNSGQAGTVTLFNGGSQTRVALQLKGGPSGPQSVRIYRGKDCETDIAEKPAYYLPDSRNGNLVTTVPAPTSKLLSGNYNVLVFASNKAGARATACGHLYQS